jgi:hypothetical protein
MKMEMKKRVEINTGDLEENWEELAETIGETTLAKVIVKWFNDANFNDDPAMWLGLQNSLMERGLKLVRKEKVELVIP